MTGSTDLLAAPQIEISGGLFFFTDHPRDARGTMRFLTVSDKVMDTLYGPYLQANVGFVDLILSAGDLPFYYLDFLMSTLCVPSFFVYGNHGAEGELSEEESNQKLVRGCFNLDNRTVCFNGLLLAGLEGSVRYNLSPRFQYTEREMFLKVLRLTPRLLWNKRRYGRYLDILLTHSPPFGIHDGKDKAHTGFRALLHFMHWFRPRYLIHGHQHIYRRDTVVETRYEETIVINTFGYRIMEWT